VRWDFSTADTERPLTLVLPCALARDGPAALVGARTGPTAVAIAGVNRGLRTGVLSHDDPPGPVDRGSARDLGRGDIVCSALLRTPSWQWSWAGERKRSGWQHADLALLAKTETDEWAAGWITPPQCPGREGQRDATGNPAGRRLILLTSQNGLIGHHLLTSTALPPLTQPVRMR
jgi:hypothetical protein